MTEIISLDDAVKNGEKYYFTGKPCKHGHLAQRYVTGSCCVECARSRAMKYVHEYHQETLERKAKYRRANGAKIRVYRASYQYLERERLRKQLWRLNNPEKHRFYQKKYDEKVGNLIAVLRATMPELIKEFGL